MTTVYGQSPAGVVCDVCGLERPSLVYRRHVDPYATGDSPTEYEFLRVYCPYGGCDLRDEDGKQVDPSDFEIDLI